MDDEFIREHINEVFRNRHPNWAFCTAAILVDVGDGLRQHGTGTLFKVGDRHFLITASHVVVPPYASLKLKLFLVGPSGTVPIPLGGKHIVTHDSGGVEDDPADIAIWELSASTVASLGDCTFLCQADIVADDDFGNDYYFLTGFPTAWANTDVGSTRGLGLLTYCTQPFDGSTSAPSYRADWHILLNRGSAMRVAGEKADVPAQLNGISGCSIWRSYFTVGGKAGAARVVAVQTGTLKAGTVIKGTRWGLVTRMLVESYPDLKPAFSLNLPHH